ncbi:hypothetical protein A1Q2_05940 [Trichosporon asahii var. asahii CBS 8904]|uniref:BTB domain-containing protein n=1 Tax=Trichosporon asahii var. asahii (strain CBS 8904) TaxID=1220162 RepID=K1VKL3_TRIAC|nr:hypothetical protein A1Q2_05940 [Trichosporon asahii var. asahii CBS 8904]
MSDTSNVRDHHFWRFGDFILISADRVRFRISSRSLFMARWASSTPKLTLSKVFADAAECAGSSEKILEFTDQTIESAAVLDVFMRLAVCGEYFLSSSFGPSKDNLTDLEDCQRHMNVLNFLKKYDCPILIRLLEMSLYDLLPYDSVRRIPIFFMGAVLENRNICAAALEKMCKANFEQRTNTSPPRVCPADPGSISNDIWKRLPPKYARAWVVGWAMGEGAGGHLNDPGQHNLDQVIRCFKYATESYDSDDEAESDDSDGKSEEVL